MRELVIQRRVRSCIALNQPFSIGVVVQRTRKSLDNVDCAVQTSSRQAACEQLQSVCSLVSQWEGVVR